LTQKEIRSYAAWSNDEDVRKKCSSGGIGFEIARHLIDNGYETVLCKYNIKKQRAEHYIAKEKEELLASIGSKYIQSYTADAFKRIDRKKKYLVAGTPCQIDSFRRMIKIYKCEENFILMDFFCHSVPTMHLWKNYIKMLEPVTGKINYVSWRNKFQYGWHDSWIMGIDGEKTSPPINWHDSYNLLIREKKTFIQSRMSQGDWFYKMFLGDMCHGKQCSLNCKYKYDRSSADIRIGDLWGETYKDNQKGVSACVAFTEKGHRVIDEMKSITLHKHPFNVVAEGQMRHNAGFNPMYPIVMAFFRHSTYLSQRQWEVVFFLFNKPLRAIAKLKRLSKKLL